MKEYQAIHPDGQVVTGVWAERIEDLSDRTHLKVQDRTIAMFPWPWAVFEVKKPEVIS